MKKDKIDKRTNNNMTMKSLDKQIRERNEVVDKKLDDLSIDIDKKFAALLESNQKIFQTMAKGKSSEDIYQHADERNVKFKEGDSKADAEVIEVSLTSVDSAEFKEKADQMRFDKEMVEIMVMPSQAVYPDNTFTVSVNGTPKLILRGKKQWLPRNYVEVLLRAKTSSYGNIETINPYTAIKEMSYPETKSHRYPLHIITDKNPKGARWLERVCNDMRV
ncbi:MAG: hypothetical protein COA71_14595 [SAR86 cluster bacterium]|uniref:Uncharacterized protein n=1 Tax=SAR86 cluster bacterium TaxID=2030880 RepID=A0A2A5C5Q6_9GAMM|nr:MAG: hypothetical protein COA71_14595 [SAR86 cluster bacterium]